MSSTKDLWISWEQNQFFSIICIWKYIYSDRFYHCIFYHCTSAQNKSKQPFCIKTEDCFRAENLKWPPYWFLTPLILSYRAPEIFLPGLSPTMWCSCSLHYYQTHRNTWINLMHTCGDLNYLVSVQCGTRISNLIWCKQYGNW